MNDLSTHRGQLAQSGDRALRAEFLDETDCRSQGDDHHDGNGVREVADDARDHRCGDQHENHEVVELGEEHAREAAPCPFLNDVAARL